MTIGNAIHRLRTNAKLSQEAFAHLFDVTQQSVQKWENGDTVPSLDKITRICKYFGLSLDAIVLGSDNRVVELQGGTQLIKPQYESIHDWEFYAANLETELRQSQEEGLDLEPYRALFQAAAHLPKNEICKKLGDILFEIVTNAPQQEKYPYLEPSNLETIRNLRKPYAYTGTAPQNLEEKLHGAWVGRVCGCLLGKPVEGIRTKELIPFLKATGNYPMHRYILRSDLDKVCLEDYTYGFASRTYADTVDGMPVDDDTNYTLLYQQVIEKYGRDFTPFDVSRAWLDMQPKNAYCTAERVAFCNFVKGYAPPESAVYQNPYREWIGAQIRADYFGYINPGDPATAAEMAWRDASISHTKNGIYGEMFVAAMLAVAAQTSSILDIIRGGLAEIPHTSRLYAAINEVLDAFEAGTSHADCFRMIHERFDEHNGHDWCHTISNAMIVAAALLYGGGNFGKSICMAVETGFDTDCNGATVGSILGMANGLASIPEYWREPLKDTMHTSIFGFTTVKISDCVRKTMTHL